MPKEQIKLLARDEGFDAIGFASPALPGGVGEALREFLENGHHGEMEWMERNAEKRSNPQALWAEVKTVISLGMNYAPEGDALAGLSKPHTGNFSVYARGRDYHDVMKPRLKSLARKVAALLGGDAKVFVDTAPVMEKPLAQAAGLVWQGKHSSGVSREFGSWLFLGEIFLTVEIEPDKPQPTLCGTCSKCMDICPTNAFTAPHKLDARKCISYLTIEHKGEIPDELKPLIGNRIYGCDDCLAVCPWNKFAKKAGEMAAYMRNDMEEIPLEKLAAMDEAEFRAFFAGTPVKRIGWERFMRNVRIALDNSL